MIFKRSLTASATETSCTFGSSTKSIEIFNQGTADVQVGWDENVTAHSTYIESGTGFVISEQVRILYFKTATNSTTVYITATLN